MIQSNGSYSYEDQSQVTEQDVQRKIVYAKANAQYSRFKAPYKFIGLLEAFNKNKWPMIGTGVLIGPDLVLTSAHNIYNKKKKDQYSGITFQLPINDKLVKHKVIDYRFPPQYKQSKEDDIQFDYALLKIETLAGPYNEYMQILLNYQLKEEPIGLFGYHHQYQLKGAVNKTQGSNEKKLIIQSGFWKNNVHTVVKGIYGQCNVLNYQISTKPGNSGSPIIVIRKNKYYTIGIHKGKQKGQKIAAGRMIKVKMSKALVSWQKEMMNYSIRLNLFGQHTGKDNKIEGTIYQVTKEYNKRVELKSYDIFLEDMIMKTKSLQKQNNNEQMIKLYRKQMNTITKEENTIELMKNYLQQCAFQKSQSTLVLNLKFPNHNKRTLSLMKHVRIQIKQLYALYYEELFMKIFQNFQTLQLSIKED